MNLQQRSYAPENIFRPTPAIYIEKSPHILTVTTSWGEPSAAQKVNGWIKESLEAVANNQETNLTRKPSKPQPWVERLEAALGAAHDRLIVEVNERELRGLVEVAALVFENNVLSFAQCGQPALFLKNQSGLQPIAGTVTGEWYLPPQPPLPTASLGHDSMYFVHSGSIRLANDSQILLLASQHVPAATFTTEFKLEALFSALAKDPQQQAFWLGLLDL